MEHRRRGHEWCNLCVGVGIDGPGGAVDGVRGKVNDAHMFQGALCPRTCECGDAIHQQGLDLLQMCCLAILQYGKSESSHIGMGMHVGMGCGCGVRACACIRGLCVHEMSNKSTKSFILPRSEAQLTTLVHSYNVRATVLLSLILTCNCHYIASEYHILVEFSVHL